MAFVPTLLGFAGLCQLYWGSHTLSWHII